MNSLEQHITTRGLNEIKTMNSLQDSGVVSDNCVAVKDVAEVDCLRAVKWLKMQDSLL